MPQALLDFARAENATQLVLGASRRKWLSSLLTGPGVSMRTIRDSGDIDVHIVTHAQMGRGRGLPRRTGGLPLRRRLLGYALAVALPPLLTLLLAGLRSQVNLTSDIVIFLAAVVAVAVAGGLVPAVLAAVFGSLLLNYYFTPPIHTFTIAQANNALALGIFVAVALVVSSVVDQRRPALPAGGPGQRRVRAAGHHGGQRAARPAGAGGGAQPGQGGVRPGRGHAAGARPGAGRDVGARWPPRATCRCRRRRWPTARSR